MAFESFTDFLKMGDDALYVWLSYGIALVVIAINVLAPRTAKKQLYKEHLRKVRREQKL